MEIVESGNEIIGAKAKLEKDLRLKTLLEIGFVLCQIGVSAYVSTHLHKSDQHYAMKSLAVLVHDSYRISMALANVVSSVRMVSMSKYVLKNLNNIGRLSEVQKELVVSNRHSDYSPASDAAGFGTVSILLALFLIDPTNQEDIARIVSLGLADSAFTFAILMALTFQLIRVRNATRDLVDTVLDTAATNVRVSNCGDVDGDDRGEQSGPHKKLRLIKP